MNKYIQNDIIVDAWSSERKQGQIEDVTTKAIIRYLMGVQEYSKRNAGSDVRNFSMKFTLKNVVNRLQA